MTTPPTPTPPTTSAPVPASTRETAYAIEALVARILVAGTWLAIGLVLAGVLAMLATGTDPLAHGAAPAFDLSEIPGDILALRPEGFLWAGLLTVMVLPIGRVIVSGIGFRAAHERELALVSLLVLIVVSVSVIAAVGLQP